VLEVVQRGGDDDVALLAVASLTTISDQADVHRAGQVSPLLLAELAAVRLIPGFGPGHEPLVSGKPYTLAPVQRAVPCRVQAHETVNTLRLERCDEFITAKGPVCEHHIAAFKLIHELRTYAQIVSSVRGRGEGLPASMREIDDAHQAHDREAAAGLLRGGLGVLLLVLQGVHEFDRSAVYGLEHMPMPAILRADASAHEL